MQRRNAHRQLEQEMERSHLQPQGGSSENKLEVTQGYKLSKSALSDVP